jgi:transcriptional regulator with XRE-family HTH domain
MSQKQLALSVGVSTPTVSDWIHGKKSPSRENLAKIAEVLGTTMDYLADINDPALEDRLDMREQVPPQIAIMARAMEQMTPEQRNMMVDLGKAAFKELFNEDE